MATVTFLQPTNMAAFPTTFTVSSGSAGPSEVDVHTASLFNFFILGSFTLAGNSRTGTITRVMIDNNDIGEFPNLDLSVSFFSQDVFHKRHPIHRSFCLTCSPAMIFSSARPAPIRSSALSATTRWTAARGATFSTEDQEMTDLSSVPVMKPIQL